MYTGSPIRACGVLCAVLSVLPAYCLAQIPPDHEQELELHARLARQYLKDNQAELAIGELEKLVELVPNNANAHGNLGVLLFFRGSFADAAPQLRAALEIDGNLWKIRALLGLCERRIGQESKARADLESSFPHLEEDKIRIQVGEELIADYSSVGDLDKAKAVKRVLLNVGQGSLVEPDQSPQRHGDAGDSACVQCHKDKASSYRQTSHYHTSSLPGDHTILGTFNKSDSLSIRNPDTNDGIELYFKMEESGGGFYETAVMGRVPHVQRERESIDLIIGSGIRGQSYLYWDDDALYELPVSYWSDGNRWINSPGYEDGRADFTRPIHPRCLECHASFIRLKSDGPRINRYDRSTLVAGITCETCHGPRAMHVAKMAPGAKTEHDESSPQIANPAKLPRERQIDLCALCHNGIRGDEISPAFSYHPGEPLENHVRPERGTPPEHPDVHGNQVGLLERSRCFIEDSTLTCSTCHDVHAPERSPASYSAKCLGCHQWKSCGQSAKLGRAISNNCIDCHMPVQPTNVIVSMTAGKVVRASMRNHWIKVYPKAR